MEKRYQVFVSSTYADLKDERSKVIQTLMGLDCIPAGMEHFPAMDEKQLDFIKRVIDDCDYYILIIGGRYGSTTPEGVSYTEKEYDYAIERGIKVLAFLHEKPGEIANEKSELDPELRSRLDKFREKVSTDHLVKSWTKAEELPGFVALSLSETIKTSPAIGWVRANRIANVDALGELNELRKRNEELEKRLAELGEGLPVIDGLAGLDHIAELFVDVYSELENTYDLPIRMGLGEIFKVIAPELLAPKDDSRVKPLIEGSLTLKNNWDYVESVSLDQDDFHTIKVQFLALGLVTINEQGYWLLTKKGKNTLMQLRTIKTSNR